jgi:hypothetical protein
MSGRLLLRHILLRHSLRLSILWRRHDPKSSSCLILRLPREAVLGTGSERRYKVRGSSLNRCPLRRSRTEVLRWIRVGGVGLETIYSLRERGVT